MDSGNQMAGMVDAVFGSISSTIKSAVSVSNTVCIQMPKRALVFYLTLQKELLLLPFRLFNKAFGALVKNPLMLFLRVYRAAMEEGPTAVELLTGEKNPSTEKIHNDFMEVRKAAMKVMRKETRTRWQLDMYRKKLDSLDAETEKKTEEMYKVGLEEKELLKAVASALRYLKSLKVKRDKISDCFSESLKTMMEHGSISTDKLLKMQKKIRNVETVIQEKKDACLNLLKQSLVSEPLVSELSSKNPDSNLNYTVNGGVVPHDAVRKILDMVSGENYVIKEKLSASQDTLEMILDISSSINERIAALSEKLVGSDHLNEDLNDLQRRLEEERTLLMEAEADRDLMLEKLDTLASMIKEEETYLCDTLDTFYEDSDYSSVSGSSEDHLMADQMTTVE